MTPEDGSAKKFVQPLDAPDRVECPVQESFARPSNCARIDNVVPEIRPYIDARKDYIEMRENIGGECQFYTIGRGSIYSELIFPFLLHFEAVKKAQAMAASRFF